jgi:hypothetical protein
LKIGQRELMLVQDTQPLAHELIVIRNITGRLPQGFDTGLFGNGNPDFGYEYAFQIGGDERWLAPHAKFLCWKL